MNSPEAEGHGDDPCQDLLAFTQYHGNDHDDFQLMAEFHEQIGPNPVVSVLMTLDQPMKSWYHSLFNHSICD